jgi:hypothetical protein
VGCCETDGWTQQVKRSPGGSPSHWSGERRDNVQGHITRGHYLCGDLLFGVSSRGPFGELSLSKTSSFLRLPKVNPPTGKTIFERES